MGKSIVYGLGGYDESKPNNNIVEIIDTPDEETTITVSDRLIAAGLSQEEIAVLIQDAVSARPTTEEKTDANA